MLNDPYVVEPRKQFYFLNDHAQEGIFGYVNKESHRGGAFYVSLVDKSAKEFKSLLVAWAKRVQDGPPDDTIDYRRGTDISSHNSSINSQDPIHKGNPKFLQNEAIKILLDSSGSSKDKNKAEASAFKSLGDSSFALKKKQGIIHALNEQTKNQSTTKTVTKTASNVPSVQQPSVDAEKPNEENRPSDSKLPAWDSDENRPSQ